MSTITANTAVNLNQSLFWHNGVGSPTKTASLVHEVLNTKVQDLSGSFTVSPGISGTISGIQEMIGGVVHYTITGLALNVGFFNSYAATSNFMPIMNKIFSGNDTLSGSSGNDILNGKAGADAMSGKLGDDTYIVDNAGDVVTENTGEGTDLVKSSIGYTLLANVENMMLTGIAAINATGNDSDNVLTGNAAANVLDGGLGNDTLSGGAGNDTYVMDSALDTVTELAGVGSGIDKINTALASYMLDANIENLAYTGTVAFTGTGNTLANNITGGIGNDVLNGGTGADRLVGGDGNDTLDGGAGADTLIGGLGDDTYVVGSAANLALGIAGDTVTELLGAGTDTVQSSIGYALGLNLENLTLTGTANLNGTGNLLNNILTGNSGNNTLAGGAGNDTLDGGAGIDILLGGFGDDTLVYDSADSKIDGGGNVAGYWGAFDTLKFGGVLLDLNLLTKVNGIEKLDLTGNGTNGLLVNTQNLFNLTGLFVFMPLAGGASNNQLYVTGDAGVDSVSISTLTGGWKDLGSPFPHGGVNYHEYTSPVHIKTTISGGMQFTLAQQDILYVQDTLVQHLV